MVYSPYCRRKRGIVSLLIILESKPRRFSKLKLIYCPKFTLYFEKCNAEKIP
jgi:hypothetical protein